MKKSIFILVLALLLLLTACGQQTAPTQALDPTEGSTAVTQPTQATEPSVEVTEPSAEATEASGPDIQLPEGSTPMDASALEWFKTLFSYSPDPYAYQLNYWYNMALSTQFDCPENLNLREFFYNGIVWGCGPITDEERYWLQKEYDIEFGWDIAWLPADRADGVLEYFFGLTWEETNGVGADHWIYNGETDTYYKPTSDAWVTLSKQFDFIAGAELEDGTIQLYYRRNDSLHKGQIFVITMRSKAPQGETGYYFLSNLPLE